MTEEFKEFIKLHHILILSNAVLFVLIAFITWDFLWWWDIGDWTVEGRIFFAVMFIAKNGFIWGAFNDWKKH